jgi:hypothetical protein
MAVTTKKELTALFADPMFQGLTEQGQEISYTLFQNIEYPRASEISKQLSENIIDWMMEDFKLGEGYIELTVQFNIVSFAHAALRNVELNSQEEVLHATFQMGYLFDRVLNRMKQFKQLGDQL